MKECNTRKVIVFGDDFWNTLGIIRSLGEMGAFPIFVNVCIGVSFVKHSRYIKHYWQVNTVEEGLNVLMQQYSNEPLKPVIICSADSTISCVDLQYNELCAYFIIPNAAQRQGEINRLMNKDVMLKIADKVGIAHPHSVSVDISNIRREDLNHLEVSYPCLTKPLISIKGSKADIVVSETPQLLWDTIQAILKTGCSKIQIQDFIAKEYEVLIMGCSFPDGVVVLPGIVVKLKEYTLGFASYASIDPDIEKYVDPLIIEKYIRELKYSGIFSMEFLLRDGTLYFMEINLRNDGHGYAPTYGGVNLPYIWYKGMSESAVGVYVKRINRKYEYQHEANAFNYYRFVGGGYWAFLREFLKADFHLYFSRKDIKPAFYYFFVNKMRRLIKRL